MEEEAFVEAVKARRNI